jgi:ketosteroid isomerase-like protein
MYRYLTIVLLFAGIFSILSCASPKKEEVADTEKYKETLIKADEDFAELSMQKGLKEAYLEYIDSNGVLLRPNVIPIAGADAVDYIIGLKDTGYKMQWKPSNAVVALSGELGYTYGVYQLKPSLVDTAFYGTYVSIWKKQPNGKWKFVLQSGNEGIGDEE